MLWQVIIFFYLVNFSVFSISFAIRSSVFLKSSEKIGLFPFMNKLAIHKQCVFRVFLDGENGDSCCWSWWPLVSSDGHVPPAWDFPKVEAHLVTSRLNQPISELLLCLATLGLKGSGKGWPQLTYRARAVGSKHFDTDQKGVRAVMMRGDRCTVERSGRKHYF